MEATPTLEDLLARSGHLASPEIADFARLATAAQRQRLRDGASDRREITRSTALWALMNVDGTVDAALTGAGVRRSELAALLELKSIPEPVEAGRAYLDAQFADALRGYLEPVPPTTEIGPGDLAIAILRSALDGTGGLLPSRLNQLGIDYSAAFTALERTGEIPSASQAEEVEASEASGEPFSRSVRRARDRLGVHTAVTPARIAAAIQEDHREYADGRFGHVTLRLSAGGTAIVEEWLERVRRLFDAGSVANSRHQVIDGELMVLGLAELDESLAEDLRAGGLLDSWRRSVEVLPRRTTSDRTDWSSDAPADKDSLGREFLAKALAERLRSMKGIPDSFLIHIDGPWGSGKSTLFRLLKSELEKDFLLVEVNAWREQQMGVQWWTLHHALRQAVEVDAAHNWWTKWWAKVRSRIHVIRTRLFLFLAAILVLAAVVFGLVLLADLNLTNIKAGGELADSVGKIASLIALSLAGVMAAYRFLLPESRRSAQAFVATSANPMSEVQDLFARTLKRTNKSVVFLIDDLDRCDEAYIIEFLQVVQTLVRDAPQSLPGSASHGRAAGPYAFIAAEGQWIRSSYENRYGSVRMTDVPGRPLGYLYLEKIFQLHVRLPSITKEAKQAFYESLLVPPRKWPAAEQELSAEQERLIKPYVEQIDLAPTGQDISKAAEAAEQFADPAIRMKLRGRAAVRFSELTIQVDTRHELARFGKYLEPNPRSIKLFVHTYGMLQSLRTLEGIPFQTDPLALWTVVEIRWPLLADHLRAHPDDIDPGRAPKLILELLTSAQVQAVIANSEWGPLTPDDVRDCTGRPDLS